MNTSKLIHLAAAALMSFVFLYSIPAQDRTIEVVRRSSGVFVYTYAETLNQIDPRKDYESVRKVTSEQVISDFKKLLKENEGYSPEFKKKCLPMWEYGLEFRQSETESSMFLFSFRCNTMKIVEEKLFKDFTPQRTEFYSLFQYEVNEKTSMNLKGR